MPLGCLAHATAVVSLLYDPLNLPYYPVHSLGHVCRLPHRLAGVRYACTARPGARYDQAQQGACARMLFPELCAQVS